MYPKELIIASHNLGKLNEFKGLLPKNIKIYPASDFGLEEPKETGTSFQDNAIIKAQYWSQKTGFACLADDSGICIEALEGAPGVYSKSYIENEGGIDLLFKKLSKDIRIKENPKAYFICILALIMPSSHSYSSDLSCLKSFYEGRCEGRIVFPPRGEYGHGYDPIFQPIESSKTFAEMTTNEKNQHSHRAKALKLLKESLV